MAEHSTDSLVYILEIEQKHKEFLGGIRHWENLKMASSDQYFLVKDFTPEQIESKEIKSIPFKQIYYLLEGKLFPLGNLLPLKRILSTLLWTPVNKGLPISLPSFNHNYFGINERLDLKLITSESEKEPKAMLVELKELKRAVTAISKVRFKTLQWTVIDKNKAFIIGTPLLSVQGETYWQERDVFIPTGYEFDKSVLAPIIMNKIADKNSFIIWNKSSGYFVVNKNQIEKFSLSSFRLTESYSGIDKGERL